MARLNDGFHRPGDRFLPAREVALRYRVSYQTAHRVITELREEGLLQRRESSGTFVAGKSKRLKGVELWFHPRAKESGRFGALLLGLLKVSLSRAGIRFVVRWACSDERFAADYFPVIWDAPKVLEEVRRARLYALLLNNRPAPGLLASMIDAVTTDDFSAGVCAAEVFLEQMPRDKRFAVVGGPRNDQRSVDRVNGFLQKMPQAKVFHTGSWYGDDVATIAGKVLAGRPDGIFCANDRLAEGVMKYCQTSGIPLPPVIGHDNAPIAEELHLTTIETPWEEMISAAVEVVRKRLEGYSGPARQIFLAQRPVYRLTHQNTRASSQKQWLGSRV